MDRSRGKGVTTMRPRALPLPNDCRVRLVDLPVQAGGMIAVEFNADRFGTFAVAYSNKK